MKLIVGLGNPGKEYELTRHNVGFLVVDNYLDTPKWNKDGNAYIYITNIEGIKTIFLKPLTYMNLSGEAVKRIVNYYKINLEDILVIQDDLDLQIGSFKLKKASSSGGHNGIKNIISHLGTDNFLRLKIGVGNNKTMDTKDFVLGKLSKKEVDSLNSDIYKDIITCFIKDGADKAMNIYNTKR